MLNAPVTAICGMSGKSLALKRCMPMALSGIRFSGTTTPCSREKPIRASFTRLDEKMWVSVRLRMRLLKSCVVPNPGMVAAGSGWKAGCAERMDLNTRRFLLVN